MVHHEGGYYTVQGSQQLAHNNIEIVIGGGDNTNFTQEQTLLLVSVNNNHQMCVAPHPLRLPCLEIGVRVCQMCCVTTE